MPRQPSTIADGQLAAVAAEIARTPGEDAVLLNVTFCNVGASQETVALTLVRNGVTTRRLRKVVLEPDEQFELAGLPLNYVDRLFGATTNAGAVDYVVSIAAERSRFRFRMYDGSGRPKTAARLVGVA